MLLIQVTVSAWFAGCDLKRSLELPDVRLVLLELVHGYLTVQGLILVFIGHFVAWEVLRITVRLGTFTHFSGPGLSLSFSDHVLVPDLRRFTHWHEKVLLKNIAVSYPILSDIIEKLVDCIGVPLVSQS